jgi:predicted NBD/HSP70 family sugar kinase
MLLRINEEFGYVLGIELETSYYKAVVIDFFGNSVYNKSETFEYMDIGFKERFLMVFKKLQYDLKFLKIPIIGISVGIPGCVDTHKGVIIHSVAFDTYNYDFAKEIASKYDIPVIIENDANCCAWGELFLNRNRNLKNFCYLLTEFHREKTRYGMGIGVGIVIDGKVYYGDNYNAGEFKSVFWNNKMKGQVGIPEKDLERINYDENVIRASIEEILMNFSTIISILNPGHIFVGGDLKKYKNICMELLNGKLNSYYVGMPENGCKIEFSDLGENDVAVGAASMFLEKIFAVPQLYKTDAYYSINWDDIFAYIKKGQVFPSYEGII